ncbi:unnamed protein product, partial [marine sediment metagenome]
DLELKSLSGIAGYEMGAMTHDDFEVLEKTNNDLELMKKLYAFRDEAGNYPFRYENMVMAARNETLQIDSPFMLYDQVSAEDLFIPLYQANMQGLILNDSHYGRTLAENLQNRSINRISAGMKCDQDGYRTKIEIFNRILPKRDKAGLESDEETKKLLNDVEIDIDKIIGARSAKNQGFELETLYTKCYWKDIIAIKEKVADWKEGLWKPKGSLSYEDCVQLNWSHGVGDITYVNRKGKLVIIEIKRTGMVFLRSSGEYHSIITTD